ncbi:MAG: polymerase sigma-70 factor, subfamily [Gaiellales bacterium]|nr:polymerase sigma-70 factor, subfamily [Gaiellales bacterium]MDX6549783.1 polymerase sigma-70 factor, subfamily [Gaiellales bacterium]
MYAEYGRLLWRALLVTAGGRAEIAEDATAEAFTRLLTYRAGVHDPQAWLFRTGSRLVIEELRRQQRLVPAADWATPDRSESPFSPELSAALALLAPEQRLVLFLIHYADLPLREVARLTGSTLAAVKVRAHRGRKALRTLLEEGTHA